MSESFASAALLILVIGGIIVVLFQTARRRELPNRWRITILTVAVTLLALAAIYGFRQG